MTNHRTRPFGEVVWYQRSTCERITNHKGRPFLAIRDSLPAKWSVLELDTDRLEMATILRVFNAPVVTGDLSATVIRMAEDPSRYTTPVNRPLLPGREYA